MQKITYVATCLFGLERFVGEEIDALGYKRLYTMDGRVVFEGDISAVARCNMWLRTAEHLYIRLGEFDALSFDMLFEGTKALPWEEWIGPDDAFPVKGHSIKSTLTSIPDCQSIIKKAVCVRLGEEYGMNTLPEEGTKHQIEFFIFKDKASLMIDTSGAPLYKRGYRKETGEAPLRETLAAAIAKTSRPREDVLFWDPMAGSGTIPIEASLIMSNTAPGLYRTFAAESFDDIPQNIFKEAREEANSLIKKPTFEAYATDIDPKMVEIIRQNIKSAKMGDYIKAFEKDALTLTTGGRRGTIVTNPPYGERLLDKQKAQELYKAMGKAFAKLDRWQLYILVEEENFERLYGRKADKTLKLYNGMIPCHLIEYFKNDKQNSQENKNDNKTNSKNEK